MSISIKKEINSTTKSEFEFRAVIRDGHIRVYVFELKSYDKEGNIDYESSYSRFPDNRYKLKRKDFFVPDFIMKSVRKDLIRLMKFE